MVRDDPGPCPGDRRVVLLRCALVGRDVPDPAADQLGCPLTAMPAHGNEGQLNVLTVPERGSRRCDYRQDLGQFRWRAVRWPAVRQIGVRRAAVRWPAMRWPAVRQIGVRWPAVRQIGVHWPAVRQIAARWPALRQIGMRHLGTAMIACVTVRKPARSALVTVACTARSRALISARAWSATGCPSWVSETRKDRRSAGSSSRTTRPRRASRSSTLVSVVGLVAVAAASSPMLRGGPLARIARALISAPAESRSASLACSAARLA